MKLEFHPEAEVELIEAAAHYELQVPGLGERFEAEVRRALVHLLGMSLEELILRQAVAAGSRPLRDGP